MPDNAYSDPTPDALDQADVTQSDTDEAQIEAEAGHPAAHRPYQWSGIYLPHDAQQITIQANLAKEEQQRQLDLVQNVYGVTGPAADVAKAQLSLSNMAQAQTLYNTENTGSTTEEGQY